MRVRRVQQFEWVATLCHEKVNTGKDFERRMPRQNALEIMFALAGFGVSFCILSEGLLQKKLLAQAGLHHNQIITLIPKTIKMICIINPFEIIDWF